MKGHTFGKSFFSICVFILIVDLSVIDHNNYYECYKIVLILFTLDSNAQKSTFVMKKYLC